MSDHDQAVTPAADPTEAAYARLRAANGPRQADADLRAVAPQLAEIAAGLAALDRTLATEAEPAIVERVDAGDW